tara:strand:+ start:459 stop:710 length:252 start_codon:yes stop_codon:yes gene_type:complete
MDIPKLKKSATKGDIMEYLKWLAQSDYSYHIDDNPEDVIWGKTKVTKKMIKRLRRNTNIMWTVCNYGELWDWYGEFVKLREVE